MTVSGTVSTTSFDTGKVIDHAFRRCRVPAQKITSEMQETARSCLYLTLSNLVNRGVQLWCVEPVDLPLVEGEAAVDTPVGTAEVLHVNVRVNGVERPVSKMSREDYALIPNKSSKGVPVNYWYDRKRDQPTVVVWPAPDALAASGGLVVWRRRHIMDVGSLTQTLDIPQRWYEAVIAMLAHSVAMETQEVDLSLVPMLKAAADEAFYLAQVAENDGAVIRLAPSIRMYTR